MAKALAAAPEVPLEGRPEALALANQEVVAWKAALRSPLLSCPAPSLWCIFFLHHLPCLLPLTKVSPLSHYPTGYPKRRPFFRVS